jgi:glycerol-3-phosphate dehydrogenase
LSAADDPMPPAWSAADLRGLAARLREPDAPTWDLVVVGAGITGAGVARDAALRGLSVLVLEAEDVAFGTSSRSSRLIHGGVRYLEQGRLGLVYEALRERRILIRGAPHLVVPARFLFPTYRGDRLGPGRLRLGLTLYDALALFRGGRHRFVSAAETRALVPQLSAEGLRGAVEYEDAVTDDARLTLTVLQDARRHGAQVLTYAPVVGIAAGSPGAAARHLVALEDGTRVPARAVVAATGPWTGERLLGGPGRRLLTLSKGIHIVVRREHLPVDQPVVVQAPRERRILFVVPWGSRTYFGTTDHAWDGDPGTEVVTDEERAELLGLVARIFTGADLRPQNVVSSWCGVRPLVHGGNDGEDTVELARAHRIVDGDGGVIGIVGGKLTTYRSMAEEVVDLVVRRLARAGVAACRTATVPLVPGGADDGAPDDALVADLRPRHGPLAGHLAARARAVPGLAERLADELPYRWVEVEHAVEREGCIRVDDVLRRRLPLALTDPERAARIAGRVARALGS